MSIKWRVILIALATLASIVALWPRTITVRERNPQTGISENKRVKRVPLKLGLDLQGGMHLALEVDESKGAVADKSDALDRALKVVRNRIDQFGVAEPVVQRVGEDRIIVELPGIDDPQRAEAIIKTSAFLTFQIVDKANTLERSLPRIDAALKAKGADAGTTQAKATTDTARRGALADLLTPSGDTTARVAQDSAVKDTGRLTCGGGGPLSEIPPPRGMPGVDFLLF